jgi:RNA polymerase sigma-70 factor (ECF subfamily)
MGVSLRVGPYGCRTTAVRVLWVEPMHPPFDTGGMRLGARDTLDSPGLPASDGESYDDVVLPHLDAARRLASWLMRNEHDAEDVVQEASLRALRYFKTFTGGNGRGWFLRIVRNTCRAWHGHAGRAAGRESFDEQWHSRSGPPRQRGASADRADNAILLDEALRKVPRRFRKLLVLREVEGLSYRELAGEMGMPMGTVMSTLSRARQAFRCAIEPELDSCTIASRTARGRPDNDAA